MLFFVGELCRAASLLLPLSRFFLYRHQYDRSGSSRSSHNQRNQGCLLYTSIAGVEAHEKGCDQVLWLDAEERKYVEEVGSMNIMFVIDGKLVTPDLDGSILPGITRDSVMTIARDMGITVEERRVSVEEVIETAKSGAMSEAFGTGRCV